MTKTKALLATVLLAGCAGISRDCSGCAAESLGADWLVVQYRVDGTAINCWKIPSGSVTSESHSDGIYWKSPDGHMVHLSGWYSYVQVANGDWNAAAQQLGIDAVHCSAGKYPVVSGQ